MSVKEFSDVWSAVKLASEQISHAAKRTQLTGMGNVGSSDNLVVTLFLFPNLPGSQHCHCNRGGLYTTSLRWFVSYSLYLWVNVVGEESAKCGVVQELPRVEGAVDVVDPREEEVGRGGAQGDDPTGGHSIDFKKYYKLIQN